MQLNKKRAKSDSEVEVQGQRIRFTKDRFNIYTHNKPHAEKNNKIKINSNKYTEIHNLHVVESPALQPATVASYDNPSSNPRMTAPPVSSSGDGGIDKR